jgi:hypothetical protein
VVRLRGSFEQTATCTGRLAMNEPNLQVAFLCQVAAVYSLLVNRFFVLQ